VVARVHRDAMQPCGEGSVASEAPQVPIAGQEGVLNGIERVVGAAEHPEGQVVGGALMSSHQSDEGLLVSFLEPAYEVAVGGIGRGARGHPGAPETLIS